MDLSRPDGRPDAMPWQERQRRLREAAILDAAAALLAERGFAATSMDEIAAHVGISKPTLYQHFASKDAVAVAVTLDRLARAAADLTGAERAVAAGARARPELERVLGGALVRRAGGWATRGELPRAVLDESPDVARARADVWARIGALLDRAKAEGDCRADVPTPVLARYLAGLFRGDYADFADAGTTPEAYADTLVALVFGGLSPRTDDHPHADTVAGAPRPSARGRLARRASALLAGAVAAHAVAVSVARAQSVPKAERPQPLFDTKVPTQTEPVPGVPAQAGGRAPGNPQTPAALAGRPLSLGDVIDAALRANPTAGAAVATAQSARAQYLASRANIFPTLSFNPAVTTSQTQGVGSSGTGTSTGGIGTGTGTGTGTTPITTGSPIGIANQRTSFGPAVGLTFLLFDFGGRAGTIGAARETANAANSSLDATVQTTVLQAEQAYFTYQSAREVLAAQDSNVAYAGAARNAAVARFRAGLATVADTLQTATQLAQARVTALNARVDAANARQTLATVINARADASFTLATETGPQAAAASRATAELTARVDTLVARAVRDRPDVETTRDQALAATQQIRVARSALYPSVTVTGTAGYQHVANIPALTGTTYNLQLGLSFPLFDAGSRRANLQAANANADAARLRADAAATTAANQVVTSSEVLRQAAERLGASDALLASAVRNEEVARGRYQEGVGTVVDLINAQTALFTARAQNAQNRWAWATALAQLARDANLLGARGELPQAAAPALPPSTPISAGAR